MKHTTIKDIAEHLGISIATVSRSLNDKHDVKPETRKKVLQTAEELGYLANPIAKKLTQQKTYNIGVVIPEFINSFFPKVIMGIQEVLLAEGYQVLIMQSNECHETEIENIKTLLKSQVDGIILSLSRETKNIEYYQELSESGFPVVFFNRVNENIPAPKVVFDDYKWSFLSTEHLVIQGYQKIFHFMHNDSLSLTQNRIKGFLDAHEKYGLPVSKDHIFDVGLTIEEGEKIIKRLIEENNMPDALFTNDLVAVGAMRMAQKNGIKVPRELGIVGFTETRFARVMNPPLTSVLQPCNEMGRFAANLLLQRINSPELPYESITLSGKLNIRSSSLRNIAIKQ